LLHRERLVRFLSSSQNACVHAWLTKCMCACVGFGQAVGHSLLRERLLRFLSLSLSRDRSYDLDRDLDLDLDPVRGKNSERRSIKMSVLLCVQCVNRLAAKKVAADLGVHRTRAHSAAYGIL
jgi:hypothetical protein